MTANLVDLAQANYGPVHRCRNCGCVVRPSAGGWGDGAGSDDCPNLDTAHLGVLVPHVDASPLLRRSI